MRSRQRHSKNGASSCANRLTIRAKVADAVLLAGLQAELLRPNTIAYISDRLADALNALIDGRPQQRAEIEKARSGAQSKLRNLITALEDGAGGVYVLGAIREREAEIDTLTRQLEALDSPPDDRLAVIPTWVRRQLEDVAGLLSEAPERAKAEFQRLGIKFTVRPVVDEGPRAFLRAQGEGNFEHLAFSEYTPLRHFTTRGRSDPQSIGSSERRVYRGSAGESAWARLANGTTHCVAPRQLSANIQLQRGLIRRKLRHQIGSD